MNETNPPVNGPAPHSGGGKRLNPGGGVPVAVKAVLISAAVLCALFIGYLSLCAWVGDAIPDGTLVELQPGGQTVSLSGMTAQEAEDALSQAIRVDEGYTLAVTCAGQRVTVDGGVFAPDPEAMLRTLSQAQELGAAQPFLARGILYLASQAGKGRSARLELPCSYRYAQDGEAQVEQLLDELGRSVAVAPVPPSYTLEEDSVEVVSGAPGAVLDVEKAKAAILSAFREGKSSLSLPLDAVKPEVLDAELLNGLVYIAPVPVGRDDSGRATPPVVGVSIDVSAAQSALDAAAPGEALSIPLVRIQPDYVQAGEDGLLYQDLLSECVTEIGGTDGRVNNVTLAASKCNGVVLFPGDVFDFNQTVERRTTAAGYQAAPAYVNGDTVNSIGGGICQVSSSLYYCTVYADLEVVTRINHGYTITYLPDGLDATVSWGGPEYRFKNNTEFPIKIVAYVSGRTLTVQFYGTNVSGNYVKTERTQLSSSGYETVYKPDETIPQGTTKVKVTPYSGRKVVVYRCVYSPDGTLLSRTLENTSTYRSRDKVVLYNPADAESLGLTPPSTEPPATEGPATEPPVTPPPTEPPATEPPATEPPTEPPATETPSAEPSVTPPPADEPGPLPSEPDGHIPMD